MTSLVKMTVERVAELAHQAIAWAKTERWKELAPFELAIERKIAHRSRAGRPWWGPSADRDDVIESFSFEWRTQFLDAQATFQKNELVARQLLSAAKESSDGFVWVSAVDLEIILG